jgi:chemosensory pili system protein ChpA (sensor histidine kinase/response regulator)
MVGLMDLGEVAWEVEQVMNRWMQKKWPGTETLYALIDMARAPSRLDRASCARQPGRRDHRAGHRRARAQLRATKRRTRRRRGRSDAPPRDRARAVGAADDPIFAEVTMVPELVMIGTTRIAPHMLEIYLREARQHSERSPSSTRPGAARRAK